MTTLTAVYYFFPTKEDLLLAVVPCTKNEPG